MWRNELVVTFGEQRVSSVCVGQKASGVVAAVYGNGAGSLVQYVHPLSIGVHGQMPGVAASGCVDLLDLLHGASGSVDGVNINRVTRIYRHFRSEV